MTPHPPNEGGSGERGDVGAAAEHDPRLSHVVLLGPMGAGKTTIGLALSRALHMPFSDSDEAVAAAIGDSGAGFAATYGVSALHAIERDVFLAALAAAEPTVVAGAASVVDDATVRAELEHERCFWLDADPSVRGARRRSGDHRRPVTDEASAFLDAQRRPHYASLSVRRIDTTDASVEDCVDDLLEALGTGNGESG